MKPIGLARVVSAAAPVPAASGRGRGIGTCDGATFDGATFDGAMSAVRTVPASRGRWRGNGIGRDSGADAGRASAAGSIAAGCAAARAPMLPGAALSGAASGEGGKTSAPRGAIADRGAVGWAADASAVRGAPWVAALASPSGARSPRSDPFGAADG